MKRLILGSLVIAAGFAMSGCGIAMNAGNSNITKKEKVGKIRVYKSTKAQVRQILGEPGSVMVLDGGKESWSYHHTGGSVGNYFSKDGLKQGLSAGTYGLYGGGVGAGVSSSHTRTTILTLKFNSKGVLISKKYGY